jgi:hypothetical protein
MSARRVSVLLLVAALLLAVGASAASALESQPAASGSEAEASAKKRKKCPKGKVRRKGRCVKKRAAKKAPSAEMPVVVQPPAAAPPNRLLLAPAAATIAGTAPAVSSADFTPLLPTSQAFTATELDPAGSPLGDVSAAAAFSLAPDGSCAGPVCSGGTPGAHTVTATKGTASGSATLTVAPLAAAYSMTCRGANYDVDGALGDGCEIVQTEEAPKTTEASARYLGARDCFDDSEFEVSGVLASDAREHLNPAIAGFDSSTGSASEWYRVFGSGDGICFNDVSVTVLATGGAPGGNCYDLTVHTDEGDFKSAFSGLGNGTVNEEDAYPDETNIYIELEKTCTIATLTEKVSYTIKGHL